MKAIKIAVLLFTPVALTAAVYQAQAPALDLPNRIPEAAPYVTEEARVVPPPYEEAWQTQNHPGQCQSCHQKIFDEWNGSMMSNSWRDPVWRAAFLLLSRAVSTNGDCGTPSPPDGTAKARHNPFAKPGACASVFNLGTRSVTVSRPGSLLDGFCSRCHMPTNYIDNVPLRTVTIDPASGLENAPVDPAFNPTDDNGTGIAFATVDSQLRNTTSGKSGIFCAVCHSYAATRDTPFHNYSRGGTEYTPAVGTADRAHLVPADRQDIFTVADPNKRNLGYSIGAGSFRLSAHAIVVGERFGPLTATNTHGAPDVNTSSVFGQDIPFQRGDSSKHKGFHQAMYVRSEMCAACHDVTNALPIKNTLGRWVGGFPIERTYTEWANSRYADRPGNRSFDPAFKRDCQSCHMQQDYGQPGTAQTLYRDGRPLPIPHEPVATDAKPRPSFTHHFVGGNALVPRLIGKDVDGSGNVSPYPELSVFSFSSSDHHSPYSRALWTHADRKGAFAQQARMAWDRLRHVVEIDIDAPAEVRAGAALPISLTVANTGSGHNFPTGFPEGRIAWVALHAHDLATGRELSIRDRYWQRTSLGVGDLTRQEFEDPEFPGCHWKLPPGSVDPFAVQFKAVASLGDGCPTLDLPYAAPLNLIVDPATGQPIDERGQIIEARKNPLGLPQFRDLNGNGDLFDDSFLRDTRLKPLPHPQARVTIDRYAILVPAGTLGPIAITGAVYYQSVEAIVASKFLGNLVDTNGDLVLQPCVLGGLCDGRHATTEPPVVEGAPPVPMAVRSWTLPIAGAPADTTPPTISVYPADKTRHVYEDVVVKASFSEPVRPLDATDFALVDDGGAPVPARVDQIGAATFGLFPHAIRLKKGARYTARVAAGVCDPAGNCTPRDLKWTFTITADPEKATGDTSIPVGFTTRPGSLIAARARRGKAPRR